MSDLDKSASPYTRLEQDPISPSQDQAKSSNPFVVHVPQQLGKEAINVSQDQSTLSEPFISRPHQQPQVPTTTQQIQQPQTGQITMVIGNNPQQVIVPPGYALLQGPNGQLIMQPYMTNPHMMNQLPSQAPRSKITDLNGDGFMCYKIWLLILMALCCGGSIFLIVTGFSFRNGPEWFFILMAIPVMGTFSLLLVLYLALTQKNLRKARIGWIALLVHQGILFLAYVIIVAAVLDPDVVGFVSTCFWSWMTFWDLTVCFGAFKMKKILENHSRVHQAIVPLFI